MTGEQVSLYANSKLNFQQMSEIRIGLEHGLTTEQVKSYAKEELNWKEMMKIRLELE